jgi:F420-dependent oxidoreductase-like protein
MTLQVARVPVDAWAIDSLASEPGAVVVMRVSLHLVRFDWPDGPTSSASVLASLAAVIEEGGFAALSVMDHWFAYDAVQLVTEPVLESYATLAHISALTRTVRLRTLVSGVMYRQPGVLAKIVTTLDVLSGGRAQLGVGAAWYEREHIGFGIPFPAVSERFERLEETIQICLQMWSDDDGGYVGKHYQLAETVCSPQPITRPRPPIIIGGNGEKKTLRLVARYGDACNLMIDSPDAARSPLDALRRHCDEVGRDYDSVTKGVLALTDPFADLDRFLAECDRYAALGVDELVLMVDRGPAAFAERVAEEIVPRVDSERAV